MLNQPKLYGALLLCTAVGCDVLITLCCAVHWKCNQLSQQQAAEDKRVYINHCANGNDNNNNEHFKQNALSTVSEFL